MSYEMKSKEEKQLRRGRAVHGVNITSENENLRILRISKCNVKP